MTHQEAQPRRYMVEEYLALEMKSEARHDFINGQIFERPGDTATHNTIVGNCLMAFRQALEHSKSHVYTLSILLVLRENEYYTYPNPMVCGEDEGAGEIALIRRPQPVKKKKRLLEAVLNTSQIGALIGSKLTLLPIPRRLQLKQLGVPPALGQ